MFNLGVLFIHGIGPHEKRETLINFGEPFVKFWQKLFSEITQYSMETLSDQERNKISRKLENGSARNIVDEEGFISSLEQLKIQTETVNRAKNRTNPDDSPNGERKIVFGSIRAEDTLLDDDAPTASLLRFSIAGTDGKLREDHVLMAEAWWTQKTIYPNPKELFNWIVNAFPTILFMHIIGAQRGWNILGFIFNIVKIPLLILVLSLLILLVGLTSIPFSPLRIILIKFINLLMGTVGQSYALKNSLIRRNGIVSEVAKNLEWLQQRCDYVLVIAHSQGAEIARLVSQANRWPGVVEWITVGSGIKPLNLLDLETQGLIEKSSGAQKHRVNNSILGFKIAHAILFSTSIVSILIILMWLGLHVFSPDLIAALSITQTNLYKFWCYAAIVIGLIICSILAVFPEPRSIVRSTEEFRKKWRDFYASHDPVPSGKLSSIQAEEMLEQREVHNFQSTVFDHTSYFQNVEQFISRVGFYILHYLRFPALNDAIYQLIDMAHRRRRTHTVILKLVRFFALAAITGFLSWKIHQHWEWLKAKGLQTISDSETSLPDLSGLLSLFFNKAFVFEIWPLIAILIIYIFIKIKSARNFAIAENRFLKELAVYYSRISVNDANDNKD